MPFSRATAGDCGFSSQATCTPEVHPAVVWAKFKALAEGAAMRDEEAVAAQMKGQADLPGPFVSVRLSERSYSD